MNNEHSVLKRIERAATATIHLTMSVRGSLPIAFHLTLSRIAGISGVGGPISESVKMCVNNEIPEGRAKRG